MSMHTISVIAAILGGIAPIIIGAVLWIVTIKMLRDVRDALRSRDWDGAK